MMRRKTAVQWKALRVPPHQRWLCGQLQDAHIANNELSVRFPRDVMWLLVRRPDKSWIASAKDLPEYYIGLVSLGQIDSKGTEECRV
jgi:hypothetical protein